MARCFGYFFRRQPEWFDASDPFTPASIAAFLRDLPGLTPCRARSSSIAIGTHQPLSVETSRDPTRSPQLKDVWASVAVQRLRVDAPGNDGYSLFAASRSDLRRLRDLHLGYVRAMQSVIAASTRGECVGLTCAQLLVLSAVAKGLAP